MAHGRTLGLLIALVATLGFAGAAQASTLGDTYWCELDMCMGSSIGYTAAPGEANDVTVSPEAPDKIRIEDIGATISPGTGPMSSQCVVDGSGHVAVCARAPGVLVSLGDGNDRYAGTGDLGTHVEVDGNGDDDVLTGGDEADILRGGDGADRLAAGGGDDTLLGGAGADDLAGGAGTDTVSYADHAAGVTATLDGQPGDGSPGEGDGIATDVENLWGSPFDDSLTGDDGPNDLFGGRFGPFGRDTFVGRGGDDRIDADDTNPHGMVRLPADETASSLDPIDCGDGNDTAFTDLADTPLACENVLRCTMCRPAGQPPPPPGGKWPVRPASVKDPRLIGVAQVGRTLTCRRGSWSNTTVLGLRWLRNGKAIKGATSLRYRLTRTDRGTRVACSVTARGADGATTEATRALRVR